MPVPFEQLLSALIKESYARRNTIFVVFVIISLTMLAIGSIWPKRYTSFAIIHVDNSNIIRPLMMGAAEATTPIDQPTSAREIIFGEKIMTQILSKAGWLKTNPTEIEKEKIKNSIKENVTIVDYGRSLLKIEYIDSVPMRAYTTVSNMTELFIKEGEKAKIEESESAYEFIEKQVNEYLEKLTKVENELREFRSNNPDTRPGLETELSSRISRVQSDIEGTKLELRETLIGRDSLQHQLSGEAAITISQSREGQYRTKIADLQTRLEALRLDYKETYPDIIRIKHQITDLKRSMSEEISRRENAMQQAKISGSQYMDEAIALSPLYQQLRSNLSSTETRIATLKARISELEKILENEYDRARKIHGGEATLSQLTRNYRVNQEIYQDLLRRRENARVSRSLDREQQGISFKLQEPANIPLIPTGIRFLHFAAAGIILGLGVPIGLIYVMLQVDPRVRFSGVITNELNIPVLAELTRLPSYAEEHRAKLNLLLLSAGTIMVLVIYGIVGWLKYTGQL